MSVISMADSANNGVMQTPKQALNDALKDVGELGALKQGRKVLIIALDDADGKYEVSWYQAGMKMSECVALCEIGKLLHLEKMGYVLNDL